MSLFSELFVLFWFVILTFCPDLVCFANRTVYNMIGIQGINRKTFRQGMRVIETDGFVCISFKYLNAFLYHDSKVTEPYRKQTKRTEFQCIQYNDSVG